MRLLPCILVMLSLALGLNGCSLFKGKKDSPSTPPTSPGPTGGPAKFPTSGDPIVSGATPAGGSQAIIAGRVLDEYGRPAPGSFVKLVAVSEKDAAPIDVAATAEGHFIIQGLKPGVDYKLVARTKVGGTLIAGQTQTSAPNVRVVILMSKDMAGAGTPDVPGPVGDAAKTPAKTSMLGTPEPLPAWKPGSASAATTPPATATPTLSVEHDLPPVRVPVPPKEGPVGPGVASDTRPTWPPTLDIRPTPKTDTKPFTPAVPPGPGVTALGPARVPSCVLVGKQLINFALADINGETWELRSNRKGKLVLLDFWGTHCIPCQSTLPELRALDMKYRAQGLEVIGIAYETTGTTEERAYRVNEVAKRQKLMYRQLLGAPTSCPVAGQLHIDGIPTLVLVDQNGWILWRHTGRPSRVDLDELERWIQRRLPNKV